MEGWLLRIWLLAWVGVVVPFGCGSADRDDSPFATGFSSGTSASAGDAGTGHTDDGGDDAADDSGTSGGGGSDGGEEGDIKYDVEDGNSGAGDGTDAKGCNGVDLLFVVDNSGSMQPYQEALADTFPSFVDAMISSLPSGTDLHVGITSTSFGSPQAGGKGSSGCSNAQHNAEALQDHYPPPSQHNGQNGGQGRLFDHGGKSFFAIDTSDDPTGLKSWFTGAATAVGEQGSNWEMVAAGGAWIAHPDNAAHNAGFIRDKGAVLVIFVLTDEYDNSPENANAYHSLIADAKAGCGGDLCVVAGGLTPPCVPNTASNVLQQFLSSFDKPPVLGDIGSEDDTSHYPEVLGDALAQVIADTCEEIPPEG